MYTDPTGHWEKGDSDRPVAVQMALMQLTDNWNKAKASNDLSGMNSAAAIAKSVREQGLNHSIVKDKIIEMFVPKERTDLREDDAERIYINNQRDNGQKILNNLKVVDKDKEKEALKDGVITQEEWRKMRNIDHSLIYMRGTEPPPANMIKLTGKIMVFTHIF